MSGSIIQHVVYLADVAHASPNPLDVFDAPTLVIVVHDPVAHPQVLREYFSDLPGVDLFCCWLSSCSVLKTKCLHAR